MSSILSSIILILPQGLNSRLKNPITVGSYILVNYVRNLPLILTYRIALLLNKSKNPLELLEMGLEILLYT
jgi:hypothetical protein